MQVKEIMTPEVERLNAGATLQEAATRMKKLDIGMIPIYQDDQLVGMLSDRDITVRATAEGRDPKMTPVEDIMTPEIIYCFEDDEVEKASALMQEQQIRRLVVLDRDKTLAGIVSLGDIATETNTETAGKTVEAVSKE